MNWQFYWPHWYKLYPFLKFYPEDEFGPKEWVFAFGPFQFRKWR